MERKHCGSWTVSTVRRCSKSVLPHDPAELPTIHSKSMCQKFHLSSGDIVPFHAVLLSHHTGPSCVRAEHSPPTADKPSHDPASLCSHSSEEPDEPEPALIKRTFRHILCNTARPNDSIISKRGLLLARWTSPRIQVSIADWIDVDICLWGALEMWKGSHANSILSY